MSVALYLMLATLLPLLGFLALLLFGKRFGNLAGPIATIITFASFGLVVAGLLVWLAKREFNQPHDVEAITIPWIVFPGASAVPSMEAVPSPAARSALTIGILIDSLTVAMFAMVTLIASLVHLFSINYMADDPRSSRYFAYLNLLCFAMLGLLLSNSLLQLFGFWELLGVATYL